ncbi:MAG TPA: substrate-binding domain-containing protein [Mycobacteriales bacterium]|jgi:ABC-type branched-subunit amino acid transport system substrate-binding protein|nr:substrate-binding domain-containing protein [Mycobacteriales bacterium]
MTTALPRQPRRGDDLAVALVLPFQGSAGLYGPSCQVSAQLAVEELNATRGITGREIHVIEVDGGRNPEVVAAEIDRLATSKEIDAVVGWHISAVRKAIIARLAGRLPYVYTAVYEGGEQSSDVFVTGETPHSQLLPAMAWIRLELGARRWFIVGNDYVWPRRTAEEARVFAHRLGCDIVGEGYLPLGSTDFGPVLDALERSRCDAVLMLLVGQDMVHFNRQFSRHRLDRSVLRFSTILDENALMAIGSGGTHSLYAAAGYFSSLPTQSSLDFVGRIAARFGHYAPACTSLGESCYEGVHLLGQLLDARRGSTEPLHDVAARLRYHSPRGDVRLSANHVQQPVYLAAADGIQFDVAAQLTTVDG